MNKILKIIQSFLHKFSKSSKITQKISLKKKLTFKQNFNNDEYIHDSTNFKEEIFENKIIEKSDLFVDNGQLTLEESTKKAIKEIDEKINSSNLDNYAKLVNEIENHQSNELFSDIKVEEKFERIHEEKNGNEFKSKQDDNLELQNLGKRESLRKLILLIKTLSEIKSKINDINNILILDAEQDNVENHQSSELFSDIKVEEKFERIHEEKNGNEFKSKQDDNLELQNLGKRESLRKLILLIKTLSEIKSKINDINNILILDAEQDNVENHQSNELFSDIKVEEKFERIHEEKNGNEFKSKQDDNLELQNLGKRKSLRKLILLIKTLSEIKSKIDDINNILILDAEQDNVENQVDNINVTLRNDDVLLENVHNVDEVLRKEKVELHEDYKEISGECFEIVGNGQLSMFNDNIEQGILELNDEQNFNYISDENKKNLKVIQENIKQTSIFDEYNDEQLSLTELIEDEVQDDVPLEIENKGKPVNNQILETESHIISINIDEINTNYSSAVVDLNNVDSFISVLEEKIEQGKLIGYDLLQIAGNEEIKNNIHNDAIKYLKINYSKRNVASYTHKDKIIISLILIALDYYDGNYWDHVRNEYSNLYEDSSQQKMDAVIRKILAYYGHGENRYVNFVIRQSITPRFYLSNFISFVFDIYKNTFKYDLMDNMTEPLVNVFLDLSENYENKNGEFGTKDNTYKLIKTIKEIINNVNWFGELIAYTTLVLQYIDAYYWSDVEKKLPFSDFFEDEIKYWITKNKTMFFADKTRNSRERKNIWKATYELNKKNVILHIPKHLINSNYDPRSISLKVYNNDNLIRNFEKPEIVSVIGGYQLSQIDITLDNPLGKIKYVIHSNDKIIYSSENKLFRNYIMFNENHNELKCGTKYIGNVDVVLYRECVCEKVEIYSNCESYNIGTIFVDEFTNFKIDEDIMYFSYFEENKIIGNLYNNVYVKIKSHLNPLYFEVNDLIFITKDDAMHLKLQINEEYFHINNIDIITLDTKKICKLSLSSYVNNGFNYIRVINDITNEVLYSEMIFLDNSYKCNYKIDNSNIVINAESIFVTKEDYICDFKCDNPFELEFRHKYFGYPLYLIPKIEIPIYRIDDGPWKLFGNFISIKDIEPYSKIWIYGLSFDSIKLIETNDNIVVDILPKTVTGKTFITVEKIKQYSDSGYSNMSLSFFENNIVKESIHIYYKVVIDQRSFVALYDENKNEFNINFSYFGKDSIHLKLTDNDVVAYEINVDDNPAHLVLNGVEFFKNYKLEIIGGEDDLFSLNSNKYTILEKNVIFYSTNYLIGRNFQMKKCWGEMFDRSKKEWQDKYINFKSNAPYISIKENIKDEVFKAILYMNNNDLDKNLEVELELTSEISEGRFWGTLKSEGDLLLYSRKYSSILIDENFAHKNDIPISEYRFYYSSSINIDNNIEKSYPWIGTVDYLTTLGKSKLLQTKISDIPFNTSTYHGMRKVKIHTIQELINYDENKLLKMRYFELENVIEIKKFIESIGLNFND